MPVTSDMVQDLSWWIDNLKNQIRHISHGNPDMVITSDASLLGWGALSGQNKIGGRYKSDELKFHITYLELLAIFLSLKAFCTTKNDIQLQLKQIMFVLCSTLIQWVGLNLYLVMLCQGKFGCGVLTEISGFLQLMCRVF